MRNTVSHDARVRRQAQALAESGYAVQIVGVTSTLEREQMVVLDGWAVIRLPARSPLARMRAVLASAPTPPAIPDSERSAAASVRANRARDLAARLSRLIATIDFYRRSFALLRARRPQLVHCNDYNTMWPGVAAKLVLGSTLVYDAHELWADRNGRREWRPLLVAGEWLFVRVADATITASPGYAQEIARRYRVPPPRVIRNIPVDAVPPPVAAQSDPGRPVRAVYAGGLLRNRGLEQAIAALPDAPGVELTLIGPGRPGYRDELLSLAEDLGVGERVTLADPVAPERLVATIAGADFGLALIQPACLSYELTLPNKLFEYAAAGLAVLSSDVRVLSAEVRRAGLGIVVSAADPAEIAAGMRRLSEPARLERARTAARAYARSETWAVERERLAAVYAAAAGVHRVRGHHVSTGG